MGLHQGMNRLDVLRMPPIFLREKAKEEEQQSRRFQDCEYHRQAYLVVVQVILLTILSK